MGLFCSVSTWVNKPQPLLASALYTPHLTLHTGRKTTQQEKHGREKYLTRVQVVTPVLQKTQVF